MSKRAFLVEWLKLTGTQLYFRSETVRPVECVTLENAGDNFEALFCIYTNDSGTGVFSGWEGVQS